MSRAHLTRSTRDQTLWAPALALVLVQVVHGAIPGPGENGGSVLGPLVGLALLASSTGVMVGLARHRSWARPLLGATGAAVAVGFLAYHAIPLKTPLNYPYWGTGPRANAGQWLPVIASILIGAWSWHRSRARAGDDASAPAL